MEIKHYTPFLLVNILLSLAVAGLLVMGDVEVSSSAGVVASLPETLGSFESREILHCQNNQCLSSFVVSDETPLKACRRCGAELDQWAYAERLQLPPDTSLSRRQYMREYGQTFSVAVILSGEHRTSIHRPETCLTGGGFQILDSRRILVERAGKSSLSVEVLELRHQISGEKSRYAYWFSSEKYETSSYLRRTALLVWSNIIEGKASRWAYVSLLMPMSENWDTDEAALQEFIKLLGPAIQD